MLAISQPVVVHRTVENSQANGALFLLLGSYVHKLNGGLMLTQLSDIQAPFFRQLDVVYLSSKTFYDRDDRIFLHLILLSL